MFALRRNCLVDLAPVAADCLAATRAERRKGKEKEAAYDVARGQDEGAREDGSDRGGIGSDAG